MIKSKELLFLIFITTVTIILGGIYSIFNTDPLHWGFISGTALDFIQGKKLFSEIYIQYGIGEPLLFKFLNQFLTINYTSIGFITSIAYALNLLVIYLTIRKFVNPALAMLSVFIIFLLHPFAIYPWPDYWAGLFISLSCYQLVLQDNKNEIRRSVLAGVFLFVAFLFRSTYALNIMAASVAYGVLCSFTPSIRSRRISNAVLTFVVLSGLFLFSLHSQDLFHYWFIQAFGSADSQYHVGVDSIVLLLRRVFLPAKFWLPNNQIYTTVSVLFYLCLFALFQLVFKNRKNKNPDPRTSMIVFLILLGMAGIVQSMMLYEMFRIQNACSPIYPALISFFAIKYPNHADLFRLKKVQLAIGFYIVLLFFKFPHASSIFPLFDGEMNSYSKVMIPLYESHRFRAEEKNYYENLHQFLCDGKSNILNLTRDSSVPYLCPGQKNSLMIPFYAPLMVSTMYPEQITSINNGEFKAGELVVMENESQIAPGYPNSEVKLVEVGRVKRPASIRFLMEATVAVYRVEPKNQNQSKQN